MAPATRIIMVTFLTSHILSLTVNFPLKVNSGSLECGPDQSSLDLSSVDFCDLVNFLNDTPGVPKSAEFQVVESEADLNSTQDLWKDLENLLKEDTALGNTQDTKTSNCSPKTKKGRKLLSSHGQRSKVHHKPMKQESEFSENHFKHGPVKKIRIEDSETDTADESEDGRAV